MANRYSIASGLASAPSTWDGGLTVPVSGDRVLICAGHTVTLDGTFEWGDDSTATVVINAVSTTASIWVAGTLKASRTVSSTLTCKGTLQIHTTGTLDYGRTLAGTGVEDPIPLGVVATVLLNKSAAPVSCKYGNNIVDGAKWYVAGATRNPNARLVNDAAIGATTITVTQVDGWQVGDVIVIGTTDTDMNHAEERTISGVITGSVGAYVVPISSALLYLHLATGQACTFSSNVVFTSYAPATPGFCSHAWGYTQLANTREATNALFKQLGDQTKAASYYGALSVYNWGFNSANLHPLVISNTSFWSKGSVAQSVGLSLLSGTVEVPISDCAFYSGNFAIYEANGSRGKVSRCYVLSANIAFQMAYGEGAKGWSHFDCIVSATQLLAYTGLATSFTRVEHLCGNRLATALALSGFQFIDCKFGSLASYALGYCVYFNSNNSSFDAVFNDCMFPPIPMVDTVASSGNIKTATAQTKIAVSNKNLDPFQQEVWTPGGVITRDNTFAKDTSGSSLKMAPYNANAPFSFSLQIYAPSNKPVAVSGYIYADTAYGATYPVTVTLSGLGITPSVWTETVTVRDAWQQFLVGGTNSTGADGMLTLTVTVQSTAGAVWVDGVSAPTPTAINSGEFGYWSNGLPAPVVSANYVAVSDVWNAATSGMTLPGSIGAALTAPGGVGGVSGVSVGDAWSNMLVRGSGSAPPAETVAAAVWNHTQ